MKLFGCDKLFHFSSGNQENKNVEQLLKYAIN